MTLRSPRLVLVQLAVLEPTAFTVSFVSSFTSGVLEACVVVVIFAGKDF